PMLAPGDKFLLEGVYTQGAIDYMNQADVFPDATANLAGTDWVKTKGWGVLAGIQHYWSPTLRSNLTGGYGQFDTGIVDNTVVPGIQGDADYWRVGLNTIWTPVAGLDI